MHASARAAAQCALLNPPHQPRPIDQVADDADALSGGGGGRAGRQAARPRAS